MNMSQTAFRRRRFADGVSPWGLCVKALLVCQFGGLDEHQREVHAVAKAVHAALCEPLPILANSCGHIVLEERKRESQREKERQTERESVAMPTERERETDTERERERERERV